MTQNVLWSRASVCLSAAACPHYCTDPDVTWGSGRGCPLAVHYWADLQSVHRLRCYGNITRTLVTSLSPSQSYDDIVRTLGGVCARCWPVTGGWRGAFSKLCAIYEKWRGWLAGNWPSTGRGVGWVLTITAVAWTAGFQWWRSGYITRTQNVSEYMLVLALCLVITANTANQTVAH